MNLPLLPMSDPVSVDHVEVFAYYDGILSGRLNYGGKRCWFELATNCDPLADDERKYIVLRQGVVVGSIGERALNGARRA